MSRTLMPRAYMLRILSSKPLNERWWGSLSTVARPLCMECEFQGVCSRWDQAPEVLRPRRALPVLQQAGSLAYTL